MLIKKECNFSWSPGFIANHAINRKPNGSRDCPVTPNTCKLNVIGWKIKFFE